MFPAVIALVVLFDHSLYNYKQTCVIGLLPMDPRRINIPQL